MQIVRFSLQRQALRILGISNPARLPTPLGLLAKRQLHVDHPRRRLVGHDGANPAMPQQSLKTPKGTRDWDGKDVALRDKIFSTITDVFKRHGAVTIDTSVNLPA